MAQVGRDIFFDQALSGSGHLSCASCHVPQNDYAPAGTTGFMPGGRRLERQGSRNVPSLMYLERQPPFSIGPDNAESEGTGTPPAAPLPTPSQSPPAGTSPTPSTAPPPAKTARNTQDSAANLVPQGGLFWDGRADTLEEQANGPLFNPDEMAADKAAVIHHLQHASYTAALLALIGPNAANKPDLLLSEALFALARYQMEEQRFHPYSSKFDLWLEGKAAFTPQERRGYLAFNDPDRANCAACHVDLVGPDRVPPLLTDYQFEALGVPANAHTPRPTPDLGLCDSGRLIAKAAGYCGMFRTPSLRNVSRRQVFFHNAALTSLTQAVDFYRLRDPMPQAFYPRNRAGQVLKYNDLPERFHPNIDTQDKPFGQAEGMAPAFSEQERDDIIAFLKTLADRRQH
ncbi:cytochrome-c peroxidase [Acetobacter sp. TBRC 12305]|uniref:Cytochrome-c peroxidase n=2 Tax=Acetobacter garciniae TaxID=2817435 RepID=A0A939HNK7_9PROT|nr:cytochrome-c peroxidase [Acetobacter garciniae]MBX0343975.1 cytochrome-c peroxidase [Acetobacter garciniae]